MGSAEGIVLALGPPGETGKAAALTQRPDPVAPTGHNFVRIGLMTDIPDQSVAGRIEDVMERNGQFDDAKAGAEVPPVTDTAEIVSRRNSSAT